MMAGLNRSTLRDNLKKFVLAALLYYARTLWRLSSSTAATTDNASNAGRGDFNAVTAGTAARGNEIENVAQGSLFGFPGFGASSEIAALAIDDGGIGGRDGKDDRTLPSLSQIQEAAVVYKRGTKVYLDYIRPSKARKRRREEYTAVIVLTIPELRQIFATGRPPPLYGPISCAIQVTHLQQDMNAIFSVIEENRAAFERTSIHLLLSEAMMVVDWSSCWTIAIKASRTDLILAIADPVKSLTMQQQRLDDVGETVVKHYIPSLRLQKRLLRIKGGDINNNDGDKDESEEAVLLSKRGGLLPLPLKDSKTRQGTVTQWTEKLRSDGFDVDSITWTQLAAKDDPAHTQKFKPSLLEMGSMHVAGLNEIVHGSVDQPRNLRAFADFIAPMDRGFEEDDVCLVTQMTFDKRERLVKLASAWGGIVSVAVFLTLNQVESLVRFVRNNHFILRFCSFHLVLYESSKNALYPINIMRNVASDAVVADYIFTVDIDFMPSLASHDTIRSYITDAHWGDRVRGGRVALVVPAFEYTVSNLPEPELFGSLPLTKTELLRSDNAIPFHLDHFFAGQKPTDYERWYKAEQPYEVQFQEKYEPYIVLCARCHSLIPQYWPNFVGYRTNKASWIKELDRAGWTFYVMPGGAFVVHMYHDISNRPTMRLGKLYDEEGKFEIYLKERYAGA